MIDIFIGVDGTTESMTSAQYMPDPTDKAMSFIGKLYEASKAPEGFKNWYPGPDTPGLVLPSECVLKPLEFLIPLLRSDTAKRSGVRVCIAGYSRGAYAALRLAQTLGKCVEGFRVHQLILLDTVKVTIQMTEDEIAQIIGRFDKSFDKNRDVNKYEVYDKGRNTYLKQTSNGGDQYSKRLEGEIYQADSRDRATGSYNAVDEAGHFNVPSNTLRVASFQRNPTVLSRDWTMGVSKVKAPGNPYDSFPPLYQLTHSGMGGMPFRGDLPTKDVTRLSEWVHCGKLARDLNKAAMGCGAFNHLSHDTLRSTRPPSSWLRNRGIDSQYSSYWHSYGSDGLLPELDFQYSNSRK